MIPLYLKKTQIVLCYHIAVMAIIISIASGKGGVGKSMLATNLGILLARKGKKVVIADLDVGGADIHILFGEFNSPYSISDFLYRKIDNLSEAICKLPFQNLSIIRGTGDTLATANMRFARKWRLINNLKKIDADIIIIDVGAGTSFHTLDFFLMADIYLTVATPDPASVLDLYGLIKLAAIRRVLSLFVAYGQMSESLTHQNFKSIEEVLEAVEETNAESREKAETAVQEFMPYLVLNRVTGKTLVNQKRLQLTLNRFVGCDIELLGKVPDDPAVTESVRAYMPVVENSPKCPASSALEEIAENLQKLF